MQRDDKLLPQHLRTGKFLVRVRKDEIVDKALARKRAAERKLLQTGSGGDLLARGIEDGVPDHRQVSLHRKLAYLSVFQQRPEQWIGGEARNASRAEQCLPRQPSRPRVRRALDARPDVRVRRDQSYAGLRQITGSRPRFGQGADDQPPRVGIEPDIAVDDAPDKARLEFRRLAQLQCAPVARQRGIRVAELAQRVAQIVVSLGVIRSKGQRPAVAFGGLARVALRLQRDSEVQVRVRVIGLE